MASLGISGVLGLMLRSEAAAPLPQTRWDWTRGRVDVVQVPEDYHSIPVVTYHFVTSARTAGLEVHIWTMNDPGRMRHLADFNVDAIMTDVPSLVLKTLGWR